MLLRLRLLLRWLRLLLLLLFISLTLSPPRQAPDWVRGNVVLVGDAAHTAPPDGQGLNMALEDVAVLGACLQESGPTKKVRSGGRCCARSRASRRVVCKHGNEHARATRAQQRK
jgi:2-polyprenyl-6-methoxyphenol hydroxylase-like FAD-dependent oxidoreductase